MTLTFMQPLTSPSHAALCRENERAKRVLRMIALAGATAHTAMGFSFLSLGVTWLAACNVGSVLTFALAYGLIQRGGVFGPSVVILTEVIIHQVLATSAMGWLYGFQYWLIPAAASGLITPGTRLREGVVAMGITVVTFAMLFGLLGRTGMLVAPRVVGWGLMTANHVGAPILTCLIVYVLNRVSNDMQARLEVEYLRSEKLLHAILPAAIAERLKDGRTTSESINPATVLFADLVGFTVWADRTSPEALVRELDGIFGAFDEMTDRLGLEKIKTIGDAYMVAGGLPGVDAKHVDAVAQLALEMREHLAHHRSGLSMRIGLHTGPVVAGVIGKRKFAFDLWGDTVNTAARMESHGSPGKIHVSEAVAACLHANFVLVERGVIEVKGKGPMRTFWLESRRPSATLA